MPTALTDEEAFPDLNGSQSARKTSLSINSLDILSVNQLLESVIWPHFSYSCSSAIVYDSKLSEVKHFTAVTQVDMFPVLNVLIVNDNVKICLSYYSSDEKQKYYVSLECWLRKCRSTITSLWILVSRLIYIFTRGETWQKELKFRISVCFFWCYI